VRCPQRAVESLSPNRLEAGRSPLRHFLALPAEYHSLKLCCTVGSFDEYLIQEDGKFGLEVEPTTNPPRLTVLYGRPHVSLEASAKSQPRIGAISSLEFRDGAKKRQI
jgi:hypothetical protein